MRPADLQSGSEQGADTATFAAIVDKVGLEMWLEPQVDGQPISTSAKVITTWKMAQRLLPSFSTLYIFTRLCA